MITGVNLFHFYFRVHVAMIQEVDVRNFNLKVEKKITIKKMKTGKHCEWI